MFLNSKNLIYYCFNIYRNNHLQWYYSNIHNHFFSNIFSQKYYNYLNENYFYSFNLHNNFFWICLHLYYYSMIVFWMYCYSNFFTPIHFCSLFAEYVKIVIFEKNFCFLICLLFEKFFYEFHWFLHILILSLFIHLQHINLDIFCFHCSIIDAIHYYFQCFYID
jgi:hypothetical protein